MARAEEVNSRVDTLAERVSNVAKLLEELRQEHKQTQQILNEHRLQYTEKIVVLTRTTEDLKKLAECQQAAEQAIAALKNICSGLSERLERRDNELDERRRRWWAFGPNLVAAIIAFVGSIITLILSTLIAYFILKK